MSEPPSVRALLRDGQAKLVRRLYREAAPLFEEACALAASQGEGDASRAILARHLAEALSEIPGRRDEAVALLTEQTSNPRQLAQLGYLLCRMENADGKPMIERARDLLAGGASLDIAKVQFLLGSALIGDDADGAYEMFASAYNTLKNELGGGHPYVSAVSVPLVLLGTDELAPYFDDHVRTRLRRDNAGEPDAAWVDEKDWARLEERLNGELQKAGAPIQRAQVERRLALVHLRNRKLRDAESLGIDALHHESEHLGDTPTFLQKETLHVMAALSFSFCRFDQAAAALAFAEDPVAKAKRLL